MKFFDYLRDLYARVRGETPAATIVRKRQQANRIIDRAQVRIDGVVNRELRVLASVAQATARRAEQLAATGELTKGLNSAVNEAQDALTSVADRVATATR